ncbi:hypothetical protein V5R04_14670 [Jonesiaceae bacterium BS-20]|uniref:Uncharacterized protein n=1 Tax=Jonesiaceae bacterium BS-20 TaxID=3120821 RepID=A0AAU7DVY3_9MICO
MANPDEKDSSRQLVQAAVAAARQQNKDEIEKAFLGFSQAPVDDVLAELCVQLQETTVDCDIERLMDSVQLPLPDDPMKILISVWKVDMEELFACADYDLSQLLAILVILIAALQDAAERI